MAKKKYNATKVKKRLRDEADRLWHLACIKKWGNRGFFTGQIATKCHHFYPKSNYAHLRYDIDNGVPIIWPQHYKLENYDKSMEAEIAMKRGKVWYNRLQARARNRPEGSFLTIAWFKGHIDRLREYLKAE